MLRDYDLFFFGSILMKNFSLGDHHSSKAEKLLLPLVRNKLVGADV